MKILVVVDMQNDFLTGALNNQSAVSIIPNIVNKIKEYRNNNYPVFATRDTHYDDYLSTVEGNKLPIPHCIYNTYGWQIEDTIALALADALIFDKNTFGSVSLAQYLYDNFKDKESLLEIEICGVCTDICVISNAILIKSYLPNSHIFVDSNLVRGVTNESHHNALMAMKCCHIDIIE